MTILFETCAFVVAYVYFGYPLMLWLGAFGRRQSFVRNEGASLPSISVIVPAHNEEAAIEAKLINLLAADYPRERVEILIGSDGSSDSTEEIVRRFSSEGVGLISFPKQQGKSAMQNGLAAAASGEILVFTDADCFLPTDGFRHLIDNFADPRVGLVTARPTYVNHGETGVTRNESIYLRYETWLRKQESERGILAMASGSLFAMRRALWHPLDQAHGDDFTLPLRVARAGMHNRLDSRVIVTTQLTQNRAGSMLRMKARIISKDFRALIEHSDLLAPWRHGALAVSLWSHKLLRWLVPYFLLMLVVTNACLLAGNTFRAALSLQAAFYGLAFVAFMRRRQASGALWSIPMSFCLVNFAALLGTLRFAAGQTSGQWKPDRETSAVMRASQPARPSGEFK